MSFPDMKRYAVSARVVVWAESEAKAVENAAACIEHYDTTTGECRISGAGWDSGSVTVRDDMRTL
jgi:hypothetical protein